RIRLSPAALEGAGNNTGMR
ncbi:hypothetical protein XPR_0741, partial [Xanthomonas arboricola pv. pruni MAFF 301420]